MTEAPRLIIGVIGGDQPAADALPVAYEVGRRVAEAGHITLTGGRGGVMHEASRGAKDAGGLTLAIVPGEDLADVNAYVDIPVITGMGFTRNALIARTANALIAVDGHYGTLSEIAFALIAKTPVVGLDTWQLRDHNEIEAPIVRAETPAEAVTTALRIARVHVRSSPPGAGPQ